MDGQNKIPFLVLLGAIDVESSAGVVPPVIVANVQKLQSTLVGKCAV